MDILAFAVYFLLTIIICLLYHYAKFKEIHKIPGPVAIKSLYESIWGHKSSEDVFNRIINLNTRYGSVAKIWTNPLRPTLVVTNLKYVEYLLSSTAHLDKAIVFDFLRPYIGTGLASSTGQQWKQHRKLLNAAFHTTILEQYLAFSEKYAQQLVDNIKQRTGKIIDVFPIIHEHTMKLICATILKTTQKPQVSKKYLDARRFFYGSVIKRLMSLWQYDIFYKFTSDYKEQMKSCEILKSLSKNLITNYKEQLQNQPLNDYIERKEFLDVLFDGNKFTGEEIMDQVNTFIIAGHDTSESLMSFIFFELARHPEVQKKIVEESVLILGSNQSAEATYAQIQQMKYLEATIKEVMRLYTLVPLIDRHINEDIMIEGRIIPSGTDITICAYSLHRCEEYFPEPEKFDPERFMPGNVEKIHPFAYIPFSMGPRICIGKTFAMTTMKSAVSKILRNFELVSVDKNVNLELTTEFVLKPLHEVKVKFMERTLNL